MEQKTYIDKLYVGLNQTQPNFAHDTIDNEKRKRRFRPKELKIEDPSLHQCPNLQGKGLGSIIMQNWSTKATVPKNIGNCLNLPVIVDRKKIQKKGLQTLYLPSPSENQKKQKDHFGLNHIREAGEKILMATQSNSTSKYSPIQSVTLSSFSSGKSNVIQSHNSTGKDYYNKTNSFLRKEEYKNNNMNVNALTTTNFNLTNKAAELANKMIVYQQLPAKKTKAKNTELINFETFNKHLYLQDNDFLYAIRKGGPVDFVLCTYQDINKSSSLSKKSILTKGKIKAPPVEYITISKNTILHYQKGQPTVYSITEWVENYLKFKKLMSIPLFKNFKTAKLFELWRRFFKKTTRAYYTEKFQKRFQLIDKHLLKGIHEIRRILEQMENANNIFSLEGLTNAVFSTTFKEIHQRNLQQLDAKIEGYRQQVKKELVKACNDSYKAYKSLKKITLDDNATISHTDDKNQQEKALSPNNRKKKNDGSINNFLKDAIPYAQDATRKTHYKKLLRYIRVIDYLFNESKFKLIRNSLNKLNMRFERLYQAYVNGWNDPPILIVTLFTMQDQIQYNPAMIALSDLIFDQFIQENIYTVVYKKSFIDPQEFPNYMICFEEVFENSVDQNSNLNNRIKEDEGILKTFASIKEHFNNCKKALNEYSSSLAPVLHNYNTYNKISFAQLEKESTPEELKGLLNSFIKENETVRQLKKVVSIGLFEFDISGLQEMVVDAPKIWLEKLRKIIPSVIVNRLNHLIEILNHYIKNLSIPISNVESFIRLKKSVEECAKEKAKIEELNNEITDLLDIVYNDQRIKLEDYDSKLITELKNLNVEFERKYDTMTYYIDNNIKQYRQDLKITISKYDNEIKEMLSSLNEDQINKYSNDAGIPIMQLENQESSINQVIEKKKLYQQLEIDLDMDDAEKSNFENLDNLTYEYRLKCELWHSVGDFQKMAHSLDSYQVLNIDVKDTSEKIAEWTKLCQVALVDLDFPYVPQGLLDNISSYEKILPVLTAIQNKNVTDNDSIYEELKSLLGISYDVTNENFVLERLMNLDNVYPAVEEIINLNHRANEEKKLKDMIAKKNDEFYIKKLLFRYRQNSDNKNDKFVFIDIRKSDLDKEFEYLESNLLMLHQAMLNPSSYVVAKEIKKLNYDIRRYMKFLNLYCDYQNFLRKSEGIIFNGEFAKEMPAELKKIINENQLKNLIKTLKDNYTLQRFLQENIYNKAFNTLSNLIESFEKNYKAITAYLDKKRREYPKYFALTDNDLIDLYESKESAEQREKMIYKLYPWIKKIELGLNSMETTGEEFLHLETIDYEKITIKVTKSSRTLRDVIDILDFGIARKLKDCFKNFKRDYDYSMRPKSEKKPKQVILDLIANKENLSQNIFLNIFYAMMDNIEKALSLEDEAFDKLFDIYHENKDDYRALFISKAKDSSIDIRQRHIYLSLIALENVYISIIEKLIRDDVQKVTDFNFIKLMNPKIENDSFIYHIMSLQLEYGFEYTGHVNNYFTMNSSDRMLISFFNCFNLKKPYVIYGVDIDAMNYALEESAYKLLGRNVHRLICSPNFTDESIRNALYANMKNGAWISIERAEVLSKEMFEILALRIKEIYRIIRESDEDGYFSEGNDKLQVNIKNLNIFMVCQGNLKTGSHLIIDKGYFKAINVPNYDYRYFIEVSLCNLAINDYEGISLKIIYVMKYANCRVDTSKGYNVLLSVFLKFLKKMRGPLYVEITKANERKIVKRALEESAKYFMNDSEYEDFTKVTTRVFLTEEEINEESQIKVDYEFDKDELLTRTLSQIVQKYHFNENSLFISKLKFLYDSLTSNFNLFILSGASLSGKSTLLHFIRALSTQMYNFDNDKYKQFLYIKVFPKGTETKNIFNDLPSFASNEEVIRNNSIFTHMLEFFTWEYKEHLNRINSIDNDLYERKSALCQDDTSALNANRTEIARAPTSIQNEEGETIEFNKENLIQENTSVINGIIFNDGEIDNTWVNYLTSIYDKSNHLTLANGDIINFNKYKLFFETCDVRHLEPNVITKAQLISLNNASLEWDNLFYFYLDTNNKVNANAELKNYIRGLFENYFPKLWDFILSNKLKALSFNENYAMKNLLTLFDAVLPMFDFEDIKIGRKNLNTTPKIEIIKKSTLSIFIFAFAWTVMNLTNFVIKTKIEKLINDIFKADDLKGPIFEYYIDDKTYDFEHWDTLLHDTNYNVVLPNKGETFYYNKFFVPSIQTIPIVWIARKVISNHESVMVTGKMSSGKTSLINFILDNNVKDETAVTSSKNNTIKYLVTPNTKSYKIERHIIDNTQRIRRDIIGDEYSRSIVLFVDDVHLACYNSDNSHEVHEYIRHLIDTKSMYDRKKNIMTFLYKFNLLCCGNITSLPINTYFNRCMMNMYLLLNVVNDESILNVYKPTLEFHLRQFIPNTSSITSTQYIQVLLKLNNSLMTELLQSPKRIHIIPSLWDVTKIIQAFHIFDFKGTSEYPEYLKKLFFYEATRVYEDRMNKQSDIDFFREKICEAYSSVFKQDKVTPKEIFNKWGESDSYMFSNNYGSEDINKINENIFYTTKKEFVDMIYQKVVEYNRNNKSFMHYDKVFINDSNIDFVIKILRAMERERKNIILLGKKHTAKASLFKLSCYIAKFNILEVDTIYASKSGAAFISEVIEKKLLIDCVYNNKKTYLLVHSNVLDNNTVLESINSLFNYEEIVKNYKFIDEPTYGALTLKEINKRLHSNLHICITLQPKTQTYLSLLSMYPYIVKHSSILYKHSMKDNDIESYFNIVYSTYKEIDLDKEQLYEAMLAIHRYSEEIYKEYASKLNMKLNVNQYHFISMFEFFVRNYTKYKNILLEKQKKINSACDVIPKCGDILGKITEEINKLTPLKEENETKINEKKEEKRQLNIDRGQLKLKKQDEEKPLSALEKEKAEKKSQLNEILTPIQEKVEKSLKPIRDLQEKDMVEIKNTYENFPFGKFMLGKVYELIGRKDQINTSTSSLIQVNPHQVSTHPSTTNTNQNDGVDWDYIKKTLNIKQIQKFCNIKISPSNEGLLNITKDVLSHPDFGLEDKYQKPFRTCGLLCEYFNQCKKYYDEYGNQSALLEEINKIKGGIEEHQKVLEEIIKNIKNIDKKIENIDSDLANAEKAKSNYMNQIEKKTNLLNITSDFLNLTKDKLQMWNEKKDTIDQLLLNFSFYLMFISAYITYAPPLNKGYRYNLEQFIYSKKANENVKEYSLLNLIFNFLDITNKDKNVFLSIQNYNQFIQENFIFMHILNTKVPYIIDPHHLSYDTIKSYLEAKDSKSVIKIQYNQRNINETLERLETSMKNGIIVFVDQCKNEITSLLNNVICDEFTYQNGDKSRKMVVIDNKKFLRNENFKLYLIKDFYQEQNKNYFEDNDWVNTLIINFSCTFEQAKDELIKILAKEYDQSLYNSLLKNKMELQKSIIKLSENEQRMNVSIDKFDYTNSVDRLSANQVVLENYQRDIIENNTILNNINVCKGKLYTINLNLEQYSLISEHGGKIYKIISKFFVYGEIFDFSFYNFEKYILEFFNEKCEETNKEEIKKREENKEKDIEEDDDDNDEPEGENNNNEEEDAPKKKRTRSKLHKVKIQYQKSNLLELINFIHNKILHIFNSDLNIKIALEIFLILYYLKEKGALPLGYKGILKELYSICYSSKSTDIDIGKEQSPCESISQYQWNLLNYISNDNNDCLKGLITSIQKNPTVWNEVLKDDDNSWINHQFNEDYLKSKFDNEDDKSIAEQLSQFDILIFYSIISPSSSHKVINIILSSLFDDYDLSAYPLLKIEYNATNKKPLLLFQNDHLYEKELRDYFFPALAESSNDVKYKEIILKGEISSSDLEFISGCTKTGGLIVIKNIHLANESITKLKTVLAENSATMSELFKLIFIVNEQYNSINPNLYDMCNIVNHSYSSNEGFNMKMSIVDIIKMIPNEIYENLLNRKNNTYIRKIVINFIFIHALLNHLRKFNKEIYKASSELSIKDLMYALKFLVNYFSTVTEDKEQHYNNLENDIGINYLNVINFTLENFYLSKLFFKDDYNRVQKIINKFFDEEKFLNDSTLLYYPIVSDTVTQVIIIPNDIKTNPEISEADLIDLFNSIPDNDFSSIIDIFSCHKESNQYKEKSFKEIYSKIAFVIYGLSDNSNDINEYIGRNVFVKKVYKIVYDMKMNFPDIIRTGEGISAMSLFKLNKQGNYSNPFDECLLIELNHMNECIHSLEVDVDNVLHVLKGEMAISAEFNQIMEYLSNGLAPPKWVKIISSNENTKIKFADWDKLFKQKIQYFNDWVTKGSVPVYHLPFFSNIKMFFSNLTMFFCRRDSDVFPETIELKYDITKYNSIEEMPKEEEANDTNTITHNTKQNNTVYISGLELINAGYNGVITLSEDNKAIKLPLVNVSAVIKEKKEGEGETKEEVKKAKDDIVIEEEDDEDEEEKEQKDENNEEPIFKEEQYIKDDNAILIPVYENRFSEGCSNNEDTPLTIFEVEFDQKYKEDFFITKGIKIFIQDS